MHIHLLENRCPTGWAAFGGYWPKGAVHDEAFRLTGAGGAPVPLQSEVTARWPDGSVKWTRHTAPAEALGPDGELIPGAGETPEGLTVTEGSDRWTVSGSRLQLTVPKAGPCLAAECLLDGLQTFRSVTPVLHLAHVREADGSVRSETRSLPWEIRGRRLECAGPLETVFRFDGIYLEDDTEKMPFRIRMSIHPDGEISFDDTFFFLGDPERDRLAGWGLRFETSLIGKPYQRHLRLLTDGAVYHDWPTQLFHWKKRLSPELLEAQMRGETVEASEELDAAAADLPRWDHFCLTQDSAWHFAVRKKAWEQGCWLDGIQGRRAPGAMAVSDPQRTLSFHIRDFWEKHPAALEAENLSGCRTVCTAWFYAPQAEPFDFRHYDRRTYPMGCYEGFDYMRPDPNGVAVTCRTTVIPRTGYCPDKELKAQNDAVRRPAVYCADPAYYHEHRAFGPWSLPRQDTEVQRWVENQITAACGFYEQEADARGWYGLFNFGDLMHTYQASRHMWRWDVGGYAWDNTELAPTYWLWLQFLRTGSERVFRMAEALSRHAADVDMYHFGYMKGLGSRHNVRHWGCPCKEPRISMAGHHRPLYYLTGDRRIGDCMEDSLSASASLASMPWFSHEDGVHVRTGPDWAALVSGWMTAYERTLDPVWREKIETGIADIKAAPLGLASGPLFGYDPETAHLRYHGEAQPGGGMHLQACMGEPEVWLETADMLESRDLADMVAGDGRFFFLPQEQKLAESGGLLEGRIFGSPIYSAEMQAWAARTAGDAAMARTVWRNLLSLLYAEKCPDGFRPEVYETRADGSPMLEIPWISTNFTAQWCLKAIVTADLIPDSEPETLAELAAELREHPPENRLYGA
ncbi:MAG: hypothetical protein IJJ42_10830 [Clostridia bacterium]|nr:hypothetical protein [Clostridia bacterium]